MTGITKRLLLISSASADPDIINDDLVARESIKYSSGDFLTELDEHYDKSISCYCGLQNEVDLIPQYLAQEDVSVISIDSSQESLRVTVCDLASCFVNSEMALPDLFEGVVDLFTRLNRRVYNLFAESFRDWVGEETEFDPQLAEYAQSHKLPNATEIAYARGDQLEKRFKLMEAWAEFLQLGRSSFHR